MGGGAERGQRRGRSAERDGRRPREERRHSRRERRADSRHRRASRRDQEGEDRRANEQPDRERSRTPRRETIYAPTTTRQERQRSIEELNAFLYKNRIGGEAHAVLANASRRLKENTNLSRKQRANFAKEELANYLLDRAKAAQLAVVQPLRHRRIPTLQPRVAVQCYNSADLERYEAGIQRGSIRARVNPSSSSTSTHRPRSLPRAVAGKTHPLPLRRSDGSRVGEYAVVFPRGTRSRESNRGEPTRASVDRAREVEDNYWEEQGEEEEGTFDPCWDEEGDLSGEEEQETFEEFLENQRVGGWIEQPESEGWEGEDPPPTAEELNAELDTYFGRRTRNIEYAYDSADDLD